MYQIDNSTAVAVIPASTAPGTSGFFTDGNPATGVPATILPAEYMNMVMMEIVGVLTAAGVTPSKTIFTQLATSIKALSQQGSSIYAADTGSANVYTVPYAPVVAALADGMVLNFKAKTANTGASTFSPNGLTAKAIVGLGQAALQGGEIVANGMCNVIYSATLDKWVLYESSGGAQQVAAATKSLHSMQAAQIQAGTGLYVAGTGGANVYAAAYAPVITALTDGMQLRFKALTANTGASTFSPNGLAAKAIVGLAQVPLQGGEIVAAGTCTVVYSLALDRWVLTSCSGGDLQVAPATQSQHAIQLGQMAAVVGGVRSAKMTVAAASATATLTADEVAVKTALGGAAWLLSSFSNAINLASTGVGGMDTGTAPVSGFVAIYAIYNPTTATSALLAVNATTARQPEVYGGANMPAGYTASALVSVWRTNASGQFVVGGQRDRRVSFPTVQALNTSVGAGSPTTLVLSTSIPKNAVGCSGAFNITSAAGSSNACTIQSDTSGTGLQFISASPGTAISGDWDLDLITDQTLYYTCTVTAAPMGAILTITSFRF
jgi:hypothetical protein